MSLTLHEWINVLFTLLLAAFAVGRLVGWSQERLELRDWREWRKTVEKGHEKMSDLASQVQVLMLDAAKREVRLTEVERRLNNHEEHDERRRGR